MLLLKYNLLFDQTPLKPNLTASKFKLEFSAESQTFSAFIDRYPVRCSSYMGSQLAETPLLLKNITSISMEKGEKDWFLLTADKTSYWIHRRLRQKCDFLAYTEQPASFDYEKLRNRSFGCVTGGIGLVWLGICLKGFTSNNDQLWGRNMFRFSLVMIMTGCLLMSLDRG